MQIHLTPRLSGVAGLVPPGARLADIGTDHALLPLFLLLQGKIENAIASDLRTGPLACAHKNAVEYGCQDKISLRLGAGLDRVQASECNTITIAGMGGQTISQILDAAPWTRQGRHTLILQPMTMLPQLRQYLWAHGYEIEQETVCPEGRRYYVVLCARGKATQGPKLPIEACYVSEALLNAPHAAAYLQALLRREQHALDGMQQGNLTSAPQLDAQRRVVQRLTKVLEGIK